MKHSRLMLVLTEDTIEAINLDTKDTASITDEFRSFMVDCLAPGFVYHSRTLVDFNNNLPVQCTLSTEYWRGWLTAYRLENPEYRWVTMNIEDGKISAVDIVTCEETLYPSIEPPEVLDTLDLDGLHKGFGTVARISA